MGLPSEFITVFHGIICHVVLQTPLPTPSSPVYVKATEAQGRIGYYNMIRGFLSDDWTIALSVGKTKHPQTRMEEVLQLLWDELCEVMWSARNAIRHSSDNCASKDESSNLLDKLLWYARQKDEVLKYCHQFLAEQSEDTMKSWTRQTCQAALSQLDAAMRWHKLECSQ